MKRTIRTAITSVLCGAVLTTLACAGAESPVALATAEPGAAATEYHSRDVNLRLFGTQAEGAEAFATVADTTTFATRNYRLGETLGRNIKLVAISENGIEISDSSTGTRRTIGAGQDFSVRLVEHDFDRAALDQGQHQWSVKSSIMNRIAARYGLGATVIAMPQPFGDWQGVKLSNVDTRSVLGRLGLLDGDLLLAIDGEPATESKTSALKSRFAERKSQVLLLTIARGGSIWESAYIVD